VHDALRQTWDSLTVRADPDCPVCGESPTVTSLVDYEQFCGMPGASDVPDGQEGAVPGAANRLIERQVTALDGHKSLYSDAYYPREEFDARYGGDAYRAVKGRYDPDGRLLDLYEKAVQRR